MSKFDVLLAVGNSAKAGVRFVSYDHFKHALADAEVSIRVPVGGLRRLTYFRG